MVPLYPELLQRPRGGHVFPARAVVNQAEDDVPHDRTRCLTGSFDTACSFQADFAGR
jgi:hypothetical protein